MDWTAHITTNRQKLLAIVAALVAMVGLGGVLREVRLEVLRTLRPAEAAVRRLIVLAAQGLVVKPFASRPMPVGLSRQLRLQRKARAAVFSMSDPQVPMVAPIPTKYFKQGPRISLVLPSDPTITAIFQAPSPAQMPPAAVVDETVALVRRLEAIQLALADLPRQARRLIRWRARREAIAATRPIYTSPLRPGRAPYLPKTPFRDVDYVLERCHLLARDALADTS
jgi:hypothetical protein